MIKTGLIKVKSIENEEIIMAITKIIMNIIIIIRMIMKIVVGNRIKR